MAGFAAGRLVSSPFGRLAWAQEPATTAPDGVVTAQGISPFGGLKYPTDFKQLDYVNKDAPKGGEISVWWPGSFDSMNPFTLKGSVGYLSNMPYELLLTGTAD